MRKIGFLGLLAFLTTLIGAGDALAIPKSMRDYSARKLLFTSGAGQITLADNDTTALIIGSAGQTGLLTLDTGNSTETVVINGTIGADSLHVNTGLVQIDEGLIVGGTFGLTGDLTLSGGAGALTFSGSASSIVLDDNDTTALLVGSTGALNLLTLNTGNDTESLIITGYVGADSLHVDVGTAQIDENLDVGDGVDITGALTVSTTSDLNGVISAGAGAGAITFDGATGTNSVLVEDNVASGLDIGSTGATNLLTLVTTDDNEALKITGYVGADSLHVDVGTAQIDENLDVGDGVDITGALTVSTTSDLNGVISAGAGAGAITFDGATGTNSVLVEDNVASGLDIGSTGATNLLTLVTTDDNEALKITGYVGADSLHVDVGTAQIDENLDVGDGVDITGALTVSTTSDLNGVISAGAGAGAITFDGATGTNSVLVEDNVASGLDIGSTGALNLLTLVTTDDNEALKITGYVGADSLHVDVGTAQIDENLDVGDGVDITGALTVSTTSDLNGVISAGAGAGAITFDGATGTNSVLVEDNVASGLDIGSTGATNLLTLVTTDDNEALKITGYVGADSLHVDVGTTQLDEAVSMGATLGVTGLTTATGGLKTTIPSMILRELRFCGQGANGATTNYMGPSNTEQLNDDGTTYEFGSAGCDGLDNTTEGTADAIWSAAWSLKVLGMACVIDDGIAGDTADFQMRDDTANVTGLTCSTSILDASGFDECTVLLDAPVTIAAGSAIAIANDMSGTDDCSGCDVECVVYFTHN